MVKRLGMVDVQEDPRIVVRKSLTVNMQVWRAIRNTDRILAMKWKSLITEVRRSYCNFIGFGETVLGILGISFHTEQKCQRSAEKSCLTGFRDELVLRDWIELDCVLGLNKWVEISLKHKIVEMLERQNGRRMVPLAQESLGQGPMFCNHLGLRWGKVSSP